MNAELEKYQIDKDRQESLEHRDVLLAIAAIIKSKEGINLFKYLFKNLEVACLPDKAETDNFLHEHLGFLRAGNSIYKLACEADYEVTANILARIERERYDDKLKLYRIESGFDNTDSTDD